mmetsp:Transcript_26166/g.68859  ORF Transcript_26166/g.68859 Transcript_26166/m.68859 type:complete len:222 (+) Transcript_26166:2638-3303(+)
MVQRSLLCVVGCVDFDIGQGQEELHYLSIPKRCRVHQRSLSTDVATVYTDPQFRLQDLLDDIHLAASRCLQERFGFGTASVHATRKSVHQRFTLSRLHADPSLNRGCLRLVADSNQHPSLVHRTHFHNVTDCSRLQLLENRAVQTLSCPHRGHTLDLIDVSLFNVKIILVISSPDQWLIHRSLVTDPPSVFGSLDHDSATLANPNDVNRNIRRQLLNDVAV